MAIISRLLKNIGLFFKRALQNQPTFCKTSPILIKNGEFAAAMISRLLKNTVLFCKRALQKRPIFCQTSPILNEKRRVSKHRTTFRETAPHLVKKKKIWIQNVDNKNLILIFQKQTWCPDGIPGLRAMPFGRCNTLCNTHCNALQRTATHCNALQHTSTSCTH